MSLILPLALAVVALLLALPFKLPIVRGTDYAEWLGMTIATSFLAWVGVVSYGVYTWLRYGDWVSITVTRAITFFSPSSALLTPTGWAGIDRLGNWYLGTSLGWTLFGFGLLLAQLVLVIDESTYRPR